MSVISILPATPAHVTALAQLSASAFYDAYAYANTKEDMEQYMSEHFTEEEISKEISNKNTFIFLVFSDERMIGYIKLGTSTGPQQLNGKQALEIERFYVIREFQSQNIGAKLLEYAIVFAKEKKVEVIWLGVWKKNLRAVKFYERSGFQKFGETIFTLGRDLQEDFLMKMEL